MAFLDFIPPPFQMGAKSLGNASATEVWGHLYCVRCLEHKRGKCTLPNFQFAPVLLLTCIKFFLIQGKQKQLRWPTTQNFALICRKQVTKIVEF